MVQLLIPGPFSVWPWNPADELTAFNANIVGLLEVDETFGAGGGIVESSARRAAAR
jgi:hypothetical protein